MTMQDPHHQVIVQRRLEQGLVTFFVGCALYVVVVYVAAPSVYTTALMLSPPPTTRYPFPAPLFLIALLTFLTVVIVGVVHHWRWLFWLLLVVFGFSILVIPATILQLMGSIPDSFPAW
jgi:ABC-type tungstate transport system substrate-binding protein